MKPIKSARVGSIVLIDIPSGRGLHGQEYKEVKARVYLVEPTRLVCAVKGREGHPYCAESYKLIKW